MDGRTPWLDDEAFRTAGDIVALADEMEEEDWEADEDDEDWEDDDDDLDDDEDWEEDDDDWEDWDEDEDDDEAFARKKRHPPEWD